MKILVTGAAGFIGSHVSRQLSILGNDVVGLDNFNNYYDVNLKYDRLNSLCGIDRNDLSGSGYSKSHLFSNFSFINLDITNREAMSRLFRKQKFDLVCHLAAQAGVRYSIENPYAYIDSNINGFITVLEGCRKNNIRRLIYASSSSVYGNSDEVPFHEDMTVKQPVSLYAATKIANELMAFSYNHLYGFCTIGLRLFTVYGPWGRPDMAPFIFSRSILNGKPVKVFNNGDMYRDFTFIDDVIEGIVRVLINEPSSKNGKSVQSEVLNIGNQIPVSISDFITSIENTCGKRAIIENLPMQPGDVHMTFANVDKLRSDYGYSPSTPLHTGIASYLKWYTGYYQIEPVYMNS